MSERKPRVRVTPDDEGLAVPSAEDVRERAEELARIAGRSPDDVTADDLRQARKELARAERADPAEWDEETVDRLESRDPGDTGKGGKRRAPKQIPADEDQIRRQLVKDGRREAEHEQQLRGLRKRE